MSSNQIIMDSPLSDMWKKIKHWYWWNFKATESQKNYWDIICSGIGFMKNGKRIDPRKIIPK